MAIYAYQRGYIQPNKTTNTPTTLRAEIDKTLLQLYNQYPRINIIILGDLQQTINNSHHHRMGPPQPPPNGDLLQLLLHPPHNLRSVIPNVYPQHPYHTWSSHSGQGKAGLDHILTNPHAISPANPCGIDLHITPSPPTL